MNGENISAEQHHSIRLVTRRKFIGAAALSGAGVASLSAHDQLTRAAAIDGVMEQHEMLNEDRMAEEIKKEKIRRATLAGPSSVTRPFGAIHSGNETQLYILRNNRGMEVAITNYGATVVSIKIPDRSGHVEDVVLGYDSARQYEEGKAHFGAIVGRYETASTNSHFRLAICAGSLNRLHLNSRTLSRDKSAN